MAREALNFDDEKLIIYLSRKQNAIKKFHRGFYFFQELRRSAYQISLIALRLSETFQSRIVFAERFR